MLFDTTLRDGEQTPGVAFSPREKAEIASWLSQCGIPELEVGVPAAGEDQVEAIRMLAEMGLHSRLITWNRATISDLEASARTGVQGVAISIPVSDIQLAHKLGKERRWVLQQLSTTVAWAKKRGYYVVVGLEDASRAQFPFLVEVARVIREEGADRLRLADTVGILTPLKTASWFSQLSSVIPMPLELHAHNDLGMATANALTALESGAAGVSVTVGGMGERAGNSALEEVALAIKNAGMDTGLELDYRGLMEVGHMVALLSQRPIPPGKPVLGKHVFTHASALHLQGIRQNPVTYEPYPPEMVGRRHAQSIGKYVDKQTILRLLSAQGMQIKGEALPELMIKIRAYCEEKKSELSIGEVMEICRPYIKGKDAVGCCS